MKLALPLLCAAAVLALATGAQAQRDRRPAPEATPDIAPAEAAPEPAAEAESSPAAPDEAPVAADAAPPAGDAAPTAEAPPAVPTVKLPAPEMQVGVKRRYRIASAAQVSRGGQTLGRSNEQLVEVEVIDAGPKPVIRYVIVEGSVKDDPIGDALLTASKGVATEYEAEVTGKPVRLTQWEKVRATILERLLLDPAAPLDGAKRTRSVLTAMDDVSAVAFAVPEMGMIADMQGWPELPVGRTEDAARTTRYGDQEARLVSYREAMPPAEGSCVAQLEGVTELDPKSPAAKNLAAALKIETTAEVSTVDGWVVSLKQAQTRLSGPQKEVRTWTITREDPPACPAAS